MREVLRSDYPRLPVLTQTISAKATEGSFSRVREFYANDADAAAIAGVLDKLRGRISQRDGALGGVAAGGMFYFTASLAEDRWMWAALKQCLLDMGDTCLQGDTHRLFCLYVAMSREALDEAAAMFCRAAEPGVA
jgi:hypothetical protein